METELTNLFYHQFSAISNIFKVLTVILYKLRSDLESFKSKVQNDVSTRLSFLPLGCYNFVVLTIMLMFIHITFMTVMDYIMHFTFMVFSFNSVRYITLHSSVMFPFLTRYNLIFWILLCYNLFCLTRRCHYGQVMSYFYMFFIYIYSVCEYLFSLVLRIFSLQ